MELNLIDDQGKATAKVSASDATFGREYNEALVHQLVTSYLANGRSGTRAQKDRGEVKHSTKKPWRQKGTGRAQAGSTRSPLWRHGGTVFGPQPRSYEYQLPKKVERGALRAALAQKLKDHQLVVVDALVADEIKTKAAAAMLKRLGVDGKAVMIDVAPDEKLARSVRNIPGVSLLPSGRVTARDVVHANRVVATRSALEKLQEALA